MRREIVLTVDFNDLGNKVEIEGITIKGVNVIDNVDTDMVADYIQFTLREEDDANNQF